jgi:hypothetical protein
MKPTQQQVDEEIIKLKQLKPKVRQMTAFGDDNHAAIDIQIEVLNGSLDEDDIYQQHDDEDITEHEKDNALEAISWLEGEGESASLAAEWAELTA